MSELDKTKIDAFWKSRTEIDNPRIATHYKQDDTHEYDLVLIRKYLKPTTHLLDMGCGTCFLSNQLIGDVAHIVAVDKYKEFLQHAVSSPKIETIASDLLNYSDDRKYDVIIMFGVANFFNDAELMKLYSFCASHLSDEGVFIVKHTCGIQEDVVIDNYSEQIGQHYHAIYRLDSREQKMLESVFSDVCKVDIYPERLNPWPNTHFYAFVCKQNN